MGTFNTRSDLRLLFCVGIYAFKIHVARNRFSVA